MIRDTLGVPVYEGDTVILAAHSSDPNALPSELRVGLVVGVSDTKLKLVMVSNRLGYVGGESVVKVPYFNVNKDTRDLLHKIASSIYQ